jgi:hypothetical protein
LNNNYLKYTKKYARIFLKLKLRVNTTNIL